MLCGDGRERKGRKGRKGGKGGGGGREEEGGSI